MPKLKLSQDHLDRLEELLIASMDKLKTEKDFIKNFQDVIKYYNDNSIDNKKAYWDCFHATPYVNKRNEWKYEVYKYANDNNVYSALKFLLKDM